MALCSRPWQTSFAHRSRFLAAKKPPLPTFVILVGRAEVLENLGKSVPFLSRQAKCSICFVWGFPAFEQEHEPCFSKAPSSITLFYSNIANIKLIFIVEMESNFTHENFEFKRIQIAAKAAIRIFCPGLMPLFPTRNKKTIAPPHLALYDMVLGSTKNMSDSAPTKRMGLLKVSCSAI